MEREEEEKNEKKEEKEEEEEKKTFFHLESELEFKGETIKVLHFDHGFFMVLKVGYFGR
jgi:hypothetical protein